MNRNWRIAPKSKQVATPKDRERVQGLIKRFHGRYGIDKNKHLEPPKNKT